MLLVASISESPKDEGAVLVNHLNQVYWEGYLHPSGEVYPLFFDSDLTLSLFRGYDTKMGSMRRVVEYGGFTNGTSC